MSDLLSLRLGALRLARRRDDVIDGAWAAARLRLNGVRLEGPDARFARDVSQRFGRRLRIARARAAQSHSAATTPVIAIPRTSSRSRLLAALAIAALLVMVLLIALPQAEELWIEPGGGLPAAAGAPAPSASPLRGRSDVVVVVVPVAT